MADRSSKPRYESMETRRMRIESLMEISEAETSTAPVLRKEIDIPEASLAGKKPTELGKAIFFFGSDLSVIALESTARKTMVCFLMFTSNDANSLTTIQCCLRSTGNVSLFFAMFFRQTALIFYQIKLTRLYAFLVCLFFCLVVSLPVNRVVLQVAVTNLFRFIVNLLIHNDLS